MKAVEFVEKHGWKKAVEVIKNRPPMNSARYRPSDNKYSSTLSSGQAVCTVQLKRLVESWEMVQIHGLENSKKIVANAPSDEHFYSWTLGNSGVKDKTVNIGELRKAIADVESVGGGV